MNVKKTVLAAGTIPWRRTKKGKVEVLLISRRRHNDMSFPKGKLDKGESMPAAAVRETLEEVGLPVVLGTNLGTINYVLGNGQKKTVQYWAAEVTREALESYEFTPNEEVHSISWVPLGKVRKTLTYEPDREIFDVFAALEAEGVLASFAVILLRHAKALPRGPEFTADHLRPLDDLGEEHAETIVHPLAAFGPLRIISSTARRCLQTVEPLAKHLSLAIRERDGISQDAWDEGDVSELRRIVRKAIARQRNVVLCSHRPVLPDLAREIAACTKIRPGRYLNESSALPPGAFSVFHIARDAEVPKIVGVEVYPVKVKSTTPA